VIRTVKGHPYISAPSVLFGDNAWTLPAKPMITKNNPGDRANLTFKKHKEKDTDLQEGCQAELRAG
jgi:hypothetical protein